MKIDHVPFKASPLVVTALLGNHIDLMVAALPPSIGQLKAGRIRGLMTTHKIKELPDIPLFSERGLAQAGMGAWLGLFAPAKIPKKIHRKLVETFEAVVNPVRKSSTFQRDGSHGALDPMFAEKGIVSSSPLQAVGLSNGVKDHDVIRKLENVGVSSFYIGPDALSKLVKEELAKVSEIVKAAGIKPE